MTDPTGSEAYTYDAVGRVTAMTKTINSVSYPLGYTYDFASDLTSITYPSGRVVQQTTDTLGRLQQITSSGVNYVSNLAYNAAWQPTGFTYGNGVQAAFAYNSRMQLQSLDYTFNSQTLFGLNYYYKLDSTNCPSGVTGNNGQIQCIDDVVDAGRSATFAYDAWFRLLAASTHGSSNYPAWGLSWNYDRYGNRLSQSVTAGTAPSNTVSASVTTNRLGSPYTYDASGNMTYDGLNSITYDGENRESLNLQSGATSSYAYDGNGLRVEKQSGVTTIYIFSQESVIAEYDNGAPANSPTTEYVYAESQLVATLSAGTTNYVQADHLSPRMLTDASAGLAGQQGHYPFGESWYAQNSITKWEFTSYERDAESQNDYAIARTYLNRLSRFSSADVFGGDSTNPQSLNRYQYVLGDPVDLVDPFGFCPPGVICVVSQLCVQQPSQCSGVGGGGGSRNRIDQPPPGFELTFGVRLPGQSFNQCLVANSANYSAGGVVDALLGTSLGRSTFGQIFTGNTFSSLYAALAGSAPNAAGTIAGFAPGAVQAGLGSTLTFGRRTADIISLNLAGKGGLPQALSSSTSGLSSLLGSLGKALSLGLSASQKATLDAGLFGAEIVGCLVPQ